MVVVGAITSTSRRRRKKTVPSPALLASLAAFVTPAVLARPVLLPFLYPSLPQATSPPQQQQQPSSSRPKAKRSAAASSSSSDPSSSRQPSASSSTPASTSEHPRAERIASNYRPDDNGHFKPTCWSLHGQSNCPRDDRVDDSVTDTDVHEVVPGEPEFSTSTSAAASTTTTITTAATPTTSSTPTSTNPSQTTVSPYTMTFEVNNIPSGWQKSGRTSFYSKRLIIGFSVTLAALICLTIVLCVIWRIKVARARRESERALREKKKEMGILSQTSDDSSSLYHDRDHEYTRQRGLRRRRANVRADSDLDSCSDAEDNETEQAPAGLTPTAARKRRTAFMKSLGGKMGLGSPVKWKKAEKKRRKQQQQTEDEGATEKVEEPQSNNDAPAVEDEPSRRTTTPSSPPPPAPPPLEQQNSFSPLLPRSTSTPPPPPPPQDEGEEESVQPPAYRRRNFGMRSRASGPAAPTPTMSARAMEKQREAGGEGGSGEGVPEEYMYLAGMMPPPAHHAPPALTPPPLEGDAALERSGVVERDREEDEELEEEEEQEEEERPTVTAHIATDDKATLARLHQASHPPNLGAIAPEAVVPREEDVFEDEEDQAAGSPPAGSTPHQSAPPPPLLSHTTFLPPPPNITSAHLFLQDELPSYVAGPSAPSISMNEKGRASAPPTVDDHQAMLRPSAPPAEEVVVVPSAPPMMDDDEEDGMVLVPSAPPLEDPRS